MTVNYSKFVATERVGGFFRLLLRWQGSIYKHVYGEMLIFLLLYGILSMSYRCLMTQDMRKTFEKFCKHCEGFSDYIPVTFVVGFYVVRVISRRWAQWESMPWPDRFAFDVSTYIHGDDIKTRMIRRTLLRYCNLGSVLCFRDICVPARKRFPHMDYLLVSGLITPKELKVYTDTTSTHDVNFWIPFQWAYTLLHRAMLEGKLTEGGMMRLHDGVNDLRNRCWTLFSYDWIPIPLVYSQVCTLAVYLYMLTCLFGRQYLYVPTAKNDEAMDVYVPFLTIFQLLFYLGWMKVAEVLINPLGLDADDFDINYIIDRNLRLSYTVVDYACNRLPPLEKDVHWDSEVPQLPHTDVSKDLNAEPFIGSAANISQSESDESSPTGDHELHEDTDRLLVRKTSSSLSASKLSGSKRFEPLRRFMSRQKSIDKSADQNNKQEQNSPESEHQEDEDDRPGLKRKSNSSPAARLGRFVGRHHPDEYYASTVTLPRIDEASSNENTVTSKDKPWFFRRGISTDHSQSGQEALLNLLAEPDLEAGQQQRDLAAADKYSKTWAPGATPPWHPNPENI